MTLIVVAGSAIGVEVRRVRRIFDVIAGIARNDGGRIGHRILELTQRVGGPELEVVLEATIHFHRQTVVSGFRAGLEGDDALEVRERLALEKINNYRTTASVEGAAHGAMS